MSGSAAGTIPIGTYNIDPVHSSVGFEIKHMGIATVRGNFREFQATIDATAGITAKGVIQVDSVDTGNEGRDADLRSANFFDAATFPEIKFESTGVEVGADGQLTLSGNLTIKDVTRQIDLAGGVGGSGEDPWGNQRLAAEVQGKINRRDFGLKYDQTVPGGNLLVGNEVRLVISVSAIKAS